MNANALLELGLPLRIDRKGNVDGRHFQALRTPNPKNNKYRRVLGQRMHRLLVETRTGMKLPPNAVVHHIEPNDKRSNDGGFVVCQDNGYHQIIERRTRAWRECGNANWWKCEKCKQWDSPENLRIYERNYRGKPESRALHRRKNDHCLDAAGNPVAAVLPQARDSEEYKAIRRERARLRREAPVTE